MEEGVDGLSARQDAPPAHRAARRRASPRWSRLTLAPPPHEATHWTARAMAEGAGPRRLDGAAHLEGARPRAASLAAFKLSTDPAFAEKLRDVVGLYVDPPAHAVVLSVDEKARSRRSTAPSPACR